MNNFTINFAFLCFGIIIGCAIGYHTMQTQLESRAKKLNWMRYDSKNDEFLFKDTVITNAGELNYFMNGTTK